MKVLDWDTAYWRVKTGLADNPDADGWAEENGIEWMWLLVPGDDPAQAQEAEERGWRFMDMRIELEAPVNSRPHLNDPRVRAWAGSDIASLLLLAREAHHITRFYADPNLDAERCHTFYEGWMRNSISGWAREVFVCEGGYISVHSEGETGSIGLIAVPEEKRKRGIGAALVGRAFEWAHDEGLQRMTVVTQGRNIPALRLFHRSGFEICDTALWFHKWWPRAER